MHASAKSVPRDLCVRREKQRIIDTLLGIYDLEVYGFVYGGRGEYPYASRDALSRLNAQLKRAEQFDQGMGDFAFSIPREDKDLLTSHAEVLNVLRIVFSRLDPILSSRLRNYHAETSSLDQLRSRFQ